MPSRSITQSLRRFLGDENGATAIEYALIASGVSVAIVAAVLTTGTSLKAMYQSVSDSLR